jgi:hypothetical protein
MGVPVPQITGGAPMKHPGPWKLREDGAREGCATLAWIIDANGAPVLAHDGGQIFRGALVTDPVFVDDEAKRMILAAPELLEMARGFKSLFCQRRAILLEPDRDEKLLDDSRALIARIEGPT